MRDTFKKVLARERWQALEVEPADRLISERVEEAGGEVWRAFLHARQHGDWVQVFSDNFGAGKRESFELAPPKITEEAIDRVIERAGGCRYKPTGPLDNLPRNADYLLMEHVIELKEIRDNALEKPERQARLANLFKKSLPDEYAVPLDSSLLPVEDREKFFEIVTEPIRRQVKSAVEQIRLTKQTLGREFSKGAILLVNSGTHFLNDKMFHFAAEKAVSRYRGTIDELITISTWTLSNGFEITFNTSMHPSPSRTPFQEAIGDAYGEELSNLMTEWARSGFLPPEDSLLPHKALGFDWEGRSYYWEPDKLPFSWGSNQES